MITKKQINTGLEVNYRKIVVIKVFVELFKAKGYNKAYKYAALLQQFLYQHKYWMNHWTHEKKRKDGFYFKVANMATGIGVLSSPTNASRTKKVLIDLGFISERKRKGRRDNKNYYKVHHDVISEALKDLGIIIHIDELIGMFYLDDPKIQNAAKGLLRNELVALTEQGESALLFNQLQYWTEKNLVALDDVQEMIREELTKPQSEWRYGWVTQSREDFNEQTLLLYKSPETIGNYMEKLEDQGVLVSKSNGVGNENSYRMVISKTVDDLAKLGYELFSLREWIGEKVSYTKLLQEMRLHQKESYPQVAKSTSGKMKTRSLFLNRPHLKVKRRCGLLKKKVPENEKTITYTSFSYISSKTLLPKINIQRCRHQPPAVDDDKPTKLIEHLRQVLVLNYILNNGQVPSFLDETSRDHSAWRKRNMPTARRLLDHYPLDYIYDTIRWAINDYYYEDKISNMFFVQRAIYSYMKSQGKTREPLEALKDNHRERKVSRLSIQKQDKESVRIAKLVRLAKERESPAR